MKSIVRYACQLVCVFMVGMICLQASVSFAAGMITVSGTHFMRDGERFEARGMNYYPKDWAWDRFWLNYGDPEVSNQINQELDKAKALGINTVRIFLRYDLFSAVDPSVYIGYLKNFINRLQARNMVAIVTLFDLAGSTIVPYTEYATGYPTSKRFINNIINSNVLNKDNPTVFAWDIKNEIDRDYNKAGYGDVKAWARTMIAEIRRLDPNHLITIGFYGVAKGNLCYNPTITNVNVYSPDIAAEFASDVDFVSMHYFLPDQCFAGSTRYNRKGDLEKFQNYSSNIGKIAGKPVVIEEFGIHTLNSGSDPHNETQHAAYFNTLLSISEAKNIAGYIFWTLNDFSYISGGLKPEDRCQGILRNSKVNCRGVSEVDYSYKPAADRVIRHYSPDVAYLDEFDGWVAPATDEPPTGWFDNYTSTGGALLRGYNLNNKLWSQTPGHVAFTKTGSSINGEATSPMLTLAKVEEYQLLKISIAMYKHSDLDHDDCELRVGVKEKGNITPIPLLTIQPQGPFPQTYSIDLRANPGWTGSHTFQIVLQLVPKGPGDGYSATYEIDWIEIAALQFFLLWTK